MPVGETETRAVRIENHTGDTVRIQLVASPPGVFQWDAVDTEVSSFEHSTISVGFQGRGQHDP